MVTKKCTNCEEIKPINEFHKHSDFKDGHSYWCKDCVRDYGKIYRKNNVEKCKKRGIIYRNNPINKLKYKEYRKIYEQENRELIREQQRIWRTNNKEVAQNLARISNKKRLESPTYRMSNNLSRGIRISLKSGKKGNHWENLVGYSLDDLIRHLEGLFKEGMSWNNYGRGGWTIDHIIPISLWYFESYDDIEFKLCWSLANLQPLWAFDNFSKHNKVV